MNDWHQQGAMGLDVIGEEEEEEEEGEIASSHSASGHEEKWFEEFLSTLGDDESSSALEAEWIESSVSTAEWDDLEYDEEGMESYTISSPPPSPPSQPVSPVLTTAPTSTSSSDTELSPEPITVSLPQVTVQVQDVPEEGDETCEDCDDNCLSSSRTAPPSFRTPTSFISPNTLSHPPSFSQKLYALSTSRDFNTSNPPVTPSITPISSCETSPDTGYGYSSIETLEDCEDDFSLPPPLHRSFSSDSASSGSDVECVTPPYRYCEELEQEIGSVVKSVKGLDLGDRGVSEGLGLIPYD